MHERFCQRRVDSLLKVHHVLTHAESAGELHVIVGNRKPCSPLGPVETAVGGAGRKLRGRGGELEADGQEIWRCFTATPFMDCTSCLRG